MKRKFSIPLFLIWHFLCAFGLNGMATPSPSTTYFKVIDTTNGLPDNSINDITEDPYGFLWVATWNGLARFDGKNFESFTDDGSENSIASNMVRCVLATEDGVWAGTDDGLDFLKFSDNQFVHAKRTTDNKSEQLIDCRISHILSSNGNLIIQTIDGDLLSLDKNSTDIANGHIIFKTLKKPRNRHYADLTPFSNGRIMALSNEGITILSDDGERELYHNFIPLHHDAYLNIFCDTVSGKVYTGDGIGSNTTVYDIVSSDGRLVPAVGSDNYKGLMSATRDNGVVSLATDGGGLYTVSDNGSYVNYIPSNSSLPCDAIYSIFADSRHNIWCGTYRHGLCMLSQELNAFTIYNAASGSLSYNIVTAIVPVGNLVYVGLDGGGIDIYDTITDRHHNINCANSELPGNNIVSMVSSGNSLYAAVYSCGLSEINLSTRNINTYKINSDTEKGNRLWIIKDDGEDNIWVGGISLHIFNKSEKSFTLVEGCDYASISTLVDDGKYMWAATRYAGILKINKKTHKIEQRYSSSPSSGGIFLPGEYAKFIFIDSSRRLWANIDNKHLCSIDIDKGNKFEIYDTRHGLQNPHVYSMIEDNNGDLWIGTDNGLYKYIRSCNTFVQKKNSRLPLTYNHNASTVADNIAYFGTTSGILSFSMASSSTESSTPPIMFTSLDILDGKSTRISLFARQNPQVTLDHGQNFFTVSFTVPEMSNLEQMQFECRLEGLEDIWRNVSATRTATYTNVPSGCYRLLVRNTNSDGSWSDPAYMSINIRPAWYASFPMIIVWILLILSISGIVLYLRKKFNDNKKKTMLMELERDSANKLNEAKLDFYATISHELRTPCFLISAQIEEMLDSERQTIPVSALHGIYRNSAKLNKLINHIIDFRKSDTGNLKLAVRKIDIVSFLENLTCDYEQLCRQKSLLFTFNHDEESIEAYVDPDKLEQIVTNLISNAYKYTPKGGYVSLTLNNAENDCVSISVADSGIGIVDKLQTAIFNPFFRTERGQAQSSGDGLGLSFVKELVELHNGEIKLESKVNEGAMFTIILPKNRPITLQAAPESPIESKPIAVTMKKPEAEIEPISNPTATRSLLIVDDDPEVLEMISRAFEGDYKISNAANGNQGLELARSGNFDIIITDIMMPEADGHELIKAIKSDPKTSSVKIVVFSALASENDMLTALDTGADAYLLKPIPLKVLRRQVDRLLETSDDPASMGSETSSGQYNKEDQKFLLECRRIIDMHIADENFGIELLATKLAMSHSSLYKKVRRITGMSLINFINEYKICKAASLFRNGNNNVQKVAEECGFRDIKTFRETFRRKMNITPRQFISKINQDCKE